MRNPIRLKNLSPRFLPFYAAAALLLFTVRPGRVDWVLGSAVVLAGALLRCWGAGHLAKTRELSFTGPYAHLRHPLYAGTLLQGMGLALTVGGWLGFAIGAGFLPWFGLHYFPRKERAEAARLEARHGRAFEDYRANVPALLPRLSAWTPTAAVRAGGAPDRRWSLARYSENNELGALLGILALQIAFGLSAWRLL